MSEASPTPPPTYRAAASPLPPGVTLREERDDDLPFLRDLYAATRADELAVVPWDEARKRAFTDQQFALQHAQYRANWPAAEWLVVERDGVPIGRVYLYRAAAEVNLMDIALMPAERGRRLGSALIGHLLAWSDALALPQTLYVEPFNTAYRLYRRLGFDFVSAAGVYHLLRREAGRAARDEPVMSAWPRRGGELS